MLDPKLHFRTEGFRGIAESLRPGPSDLARARYPPIPTHRACCGAIEMDDRLGQTMLERRTFRPFFEAYAFDTAIVDVI